MCPLFCYKSILIRLLAVSFLPRIAPPHLNTWVSLKVTKGLTRERAAAASSFLFEERNYCWPFPVSPGQLGSTRTRVQRSLNVPTYPNRLIVFISDRSYRKFVHFSPT